MNHQTIRPADQVLHHVVGLGQCCKGWVSCWKNNSVKDCLTITLTQSSAYAHDSKKIRITFLGQKGRKLSNFRCSFKVLLLPMAMELLMLLAIAAIGVVDDMFVLNAKDWEVQSQHNLRHLNTTTVLCIFLDRWEQENYKGDEPDWVEGDIFTQPRQRFYHWRRDLGV